MAKSGKLRNCPAVGRKITGQECGSNRGTRYECPPDCPYCPWTLENYGQLIEIGERIDRKLLDFYYEFVGWDEARRRLRPDEVEDALDEMDFVQRCFVEYFRREHRPGKRLFDLWREAGWVGLRNDEIFLAGCKERVRAMFFEVRRVLDDLRCECADVFDDEGKNLTICDTGLAGLAREGQVFCSWLIPGPFFYGCYVMAVPLPISSEPPRQVIARHAEMLGAPAGGDAEIAAWLEVHLAEVVRSAHEEAGTPLHGRSDDYLEEPPELEGAQAPALRLLDSPHSWWQELSNKDLLVRMASPPAERDDEFGETMLALEELLLAAVAEESGFNDDESRAMVGILWMILRILLPQDAALQPLRLQELDDEIDVLFGAIKPCANGGEFVEELIASSCQPALLEMCCRLMVQSASGDEESAGPDLGDLRPEQVLEIAITLEGVMRCLRRSALG